MATMTIRTTVAFDPATVARWERLSKRWGVSKSEALRRALETAEANQPAATPTSGEPNFSAMSPIEIMDWLRDHPSPTVPGGWGSDPHRELREMRQADARLEEERERRGARTSAMSAAAACDA
jgi:hypothetical protein